MSDYQPYVTIRSRQPAATAGARNANAMALPHTGDFYARSATHDISRTSFHVKHLGEFAQRLEDSAARAFPNRGRCNQRYKKVQALLLHWTSDDLFVIPELEDLEKCLREDYSFETDIFPIPSENSHLELMMRIGQLIKEHESEDTLFLVYYGGHARIDDSRQSTWCATRDAGSPWLQWSAIQTLLERSKSDVLILLDCCAGAASATFPNGTSITETISASSWDAIAPDPGRYSFTNALIEVLQEWRTRIFSAAMLHAEVLARLKHPRPITINGKHFEARSTPVHFMMTANHKAPSIELSRTLREGELPSSPQLMPTQPVETGRAPDTATTARNEDIATEPNEDTPHVMISLALEDDQRLDINAWEQWLNAFPAMARYVKVQGVFKSHSTLLLVSMPVTVWDLLPEDHATSFIAFIRSNNLAVQKSQPEPSSVPVPTRSRQSENTIYDSASVMSGVSGTTFTPTVNFGQTSQAGGTSTDEGFRHGISGPTNISRTPEATTQTRTLQSSWSQPSLTQTPMRSARSMQSMYASQASQASASSILAGPVTRQMILNQQQTSRRTTFGDYIPEPRKFSAHVERRLEEYYQQEPLPNDGQKAFFASNLGVEPWHIEVWFHHRRERDAFAQRLASLKMEDAKQQHSGSRPALILPGSLSELLDKSPAGQALMFDLRPQADYQKSHVRGAVNLRAPSSFLASAPLEMIGRAFVNEASRKAFTNWKNARCIIFYSRSLDPQLEYPSIQCLLTKLWARGWTGQCFILKGHYREFRESHEKHIVQNSSYPEAESMGEGQQTPEKQSQNKPALVSNEEELTELLSRLESEGQAQYLGTPTEEQSEALKDQEKQLESEFQSRFPDLYNKARDLYPDVQASSSADPDSFVSTAQMVEYLDRGLSKIRTRAAATAAAATVTTTPATTYDPGHPKLAAEGYFDRPSPTAPPPRLHEVESADEYVEISQGDEQFAADPGFPTAASGRRGEGGSGTVTGTGAGAAASNVAMAAPDDMARRGRGGGILNKVFRRG